MAATRTVPANGTAARCHLRPAQTGSYDELLEAVKTLWGIFDSFQGLDIGNQCFNLSRFKFARERRHLARFSFANPVSDLFNDKELGDLADLLGKFCE